MREPLSYPELPASSDDDEALPISLAPSAPWAVELGDTLALSTLVVATLVVCIPVLRGDLFSYMDLPVHTAELRDLARPGATGWSDAGFCGLPIDILQSPLLYRLLAGLSRVGIPLDKSLAGAAIVGLGAPALAFYALARKHMSAAWALGAAATLLLYRGSIAGTASSLAGMFPFHIAAAAFIVVMSRLEQPTRRLRDVAILAELAAVIGLSHMYLTIALVYLALIHGVACIGSREGRRKLLFDVPALALGCMGAAGYWMSNALARTVPIPERLDFAAPIKRLFTVGYPLVSPGLSALGRATHDPVFGADALLQLAVVVAAIAGARRIVREGSPAARYGAVLAVFVVAALALQAKTGFSLIGPQAFRMSYVVKIGALAAAMPLLAHASRAWPGARFAPVVALAVLAGGFAMERVTASQAVSPDEAAVAEVESLWTWMQAHRTPSWGRVYLQDTWGRLYAKHDWTGVDTADFRLDGSHLLALTGANTGLEQVGAYYGSTPFLTEDWTSAERGNTMGMHADVSELVDRVIVRMDRANATHILLTNKAVAARFAGDPRFALEHETEHYTLFSRRGRTSEFATMGGDGRGLDVDRVAPGRMHVTIDRALGEGARVDVSESYHPFWHAEPASAASLAQAKDGLMVLTPSASGPRTFDLVYSPPKSPWYVTLFAAACMLAITFADALGAKKRAARAGAR